MRYLASLFSYHILKTAYNGTIYRLPLSCNLFQREHESCCLNRPKKTYSCFYKPSNRKRDAISACLQSLIYIFQARQYSLLFMFIRAPKLGKKGLSLLTGDSSFSLIAITADVSCRLLLHLCLPLEAPDAIDLGLQCILARWPFRGIDQSTTWLMQLG